VDQCDVRFFFVLGAGFYYLINNTEDSIRPRYMETVEESLNDTAHLLSASIEVKLPKTKINPLTFKRITTDTLGPMFQNTGSRRFEAKIYSLIKKEADLQAYVTNAQGIVIFDSEGYRVGLDYSKFNDVYLTLKGKYGARSSKLLDPNEEGALFVAAPIKLNEVIIGVLTVIKPKIGVVPFIQLAKEKFWRISLIVAISIAIVFSILAYLLFRPIGKLSSYVSSLRNKKEFPFPKIGLKELELLGQEMNTLISELEGKEYIENYIQTLTHEIKSPLSSILASAELIKNQNENSSRLTKNIQREGKRIQNIIEHLLELSSLEGKRFIQKNEKIELLNMVKGMIDIFFTEAQSKSIRIEAIGNVTYVIGDKNYIEIAVKNLLRNSIDFSKPGDNIKIIIKSHEPNYTELIVLDEGQKIPEYALEKVTERFYSLPRPDTKLKSSGLGLSIVKQIAELHHAKFEIKNREESGVEAKLTFFN